MYNYEKEANAIKALSEMAKKAYSAMNPIVKETMHSLAKDESSTLAPDELISTSHALMGEPMSPDMKHIVDTLKASRSNAKGLEESFNIPAAPPLIPGGNPLPAVTPPPPHHMDAILNTNLMATIQSLNHNINAKEKAIKEHKAVRGIDSKLAKKFGKHIKMNDTNIKEAEKKLATYYDRMRYNKIKEQFGL